MEAGSLPYTLPTVEEVFRDLKGRRVGLIKALTFDVEDFYQQCDPEKANLCLYGYPNEQWEVSLPAEAVPPDLPEPTLGINFARDGMREKAWLSFVAAHSDAWLLSMASYLGARFGLDSNDRRHLFGMINELPTISEIVAGAAEKEVSEKSSITSQSSNKSEANSKGRGCESQVEQPKPALQLQKEKEEKVFDDEDEEEHGETLRGACGARCASDEFWICCGVCKKWFPRKCVKMAPARAKHVNQYKCPSCSNKKSRP